MALERAAGAAVPVVRHVLPIDEQPVLDDAGFLIPPTWDPAFAAGPQPQPTSDLLEADGGWVLLAPGGAGKTTVMRQLAATDPDGKMVDLEGLDKAEIRAELMAAAACKRVYIDSLDVIAQQEPAVFAVFRRVLRDPRSAASWRLACRPTAWRADLDRALVDAAGCAFRRLRLLPLTRYGAEALLTAEGVDQERFLDEAVRSGVRAGDLSPQTLVAMAGRWRETGELPATQAEAIEYQVARLLDEHRSEHPGRLSAGRQRRVVARLAAFSVFGGGTGFFIDPTSAGRYMPARPNVLAINELPDTPEPDIPDRVTIDEYTEALGSTLFVPAAHAAVAFSHQQYAEFLAADYLRRRLGVALGSPGQLATVLGVADGMIPAALAGVTAWLCALAPDGCATLLPANARALMASGVDFPASVRASIIEATFPDVANGDLEQFWGLDLRSLDHPDIEDQLISLLGQVSSPDHQVWWLSRIARAVSIGTSETLAAQFLPFVQDRQSAHGRSAAMATVAAIGTDAQKSFLHSFLELPEDEDPDDEILAVVARGLYPRLLPTADLLRVLRPRRDGHLIGGYYMLLNDLPGLAPATDLPRMLDWAAQARDADHDQVDRAYGPFLENLVSRAWAFADEAPVRTCLAALLVGLDGSSRWDLSRRGLPWTDGSAVDRRRALAVDVADRVDDCWQLHRFELVSGIDGDWLLDYLDGMPDKARVTLAKCVPDVLNEPTSQQVDRVLSLPAVHPAYEATRGWRDPVPLDSPQASHARRLHESKQRSRERARQVGRQSIETIRSALELAASDIGQWWRAVSVLQYDSRSNHHFDHDLTKAPLWTLLDPHEQVVLRGLGLRYVAQHRPAPRDWIGQGTVGADQVGPDWAGVYLLTTLTRHDPDAVRALPAECWDRWAMAIIATWVRTNGDEHLRADLLRLVGADGRAAFVEAALRYADLQRDGGRLAQNPVLDALCVEMASLWVERLVDGRYPDSVASALIGVLAQHAPVEAARACRHFALTGNGEVSTMAWDLLAQLDPSFVVDHLDAIGGETALERTVPFIDLKKIDDDRLQALARRLLDSLPVAEDTDFDQSEYDAGPYRMRRARHASLEVLARRGLIDHLEALQAGRDERDRTAVGTFLRRARVRRVDLDHQAVKPEQLLKLLARGDARLVRTADELLSVVLEQLRAIQHEIGTGRFRDLWNTPSGPPPTPKSEDDISDWLRAAVEARTRAVLVDREIQVQRNKPTGIGTRIDLTVTAPTQPGASVRLILEAKRVDNVGVRTSLTGQLVDRYLVPTGLRHGIYLIYWLGAWCRPPGWSGTLEPDQQALLDFLNGQCDGVAATGLHVRPFILDISLPAGWPMSGGTGAQARAGLRTPCAPR